MAAALDAETARQRDGVVLIASESLVSRATLEALGSPIAATAAEAARAVPALVARFPIY